MKIEDSSGSTCPSRRRGRCCSTSSASPRACPARSSGGRGRRVPRHREGEGRPDHRAVQGRGQDRARPTRPTTRWCSRPRAATRAARATRRPRSPPRSTPDGDRHRRCNIDTDLNITGKVAQFGRGVMADVSSKLLGQFAENLKRDVLQRRRAGARGPARRRGGDRGRRRPRRRRRGAGTTGAAEDRAPEAEPIDLHGRAPAARWAKRIAPIVVGLVVLLALRARSSSAASARSSGVRHHRGLTPLGSNPCSIRIRCARRRRRARLVLGIDPGVSRCGYGVVRA